MPTQRRQREWRGEAGAELVEMALTLPLILMVLLGLSDFGLMFQKCEVVNNSAREGARYAAAHPNTPASEVQTRVLNYIQGSGLPTAAGNPTVVVTPTTLTSGPGTWQAQQVDVAYVHDYSFFAPLASWFGGTFTSATLNARATMRIESNVTGLP
jgi:Flp pilus assembly protein TadG